MVVSVVTIFPDFFTGPLATGVLRIARDQGQLAVQLVDLRDYTDDAHRSVDDKPFGGGTGMIMKPAPIFRAVEALTPRPERVVLLTPQGERFTQRRARELAGAAALCFICGRYKGVDERVSSALVTDELSVGDFILAGGEIAALAVLEAVVRLLPGVVGDEDSVTSDSFEQGLLDAPYYTRPQVFRDLPVPEVLVSGDHGAVRRWRRRQALLRTRQRRPDLWADVPLTDEDRKLLNEDEHD